MQALRGAVAGGCGGCAGQVQVAVGAFVVWGCAIFLEVGVGLGLELVSSQQWRVF